MTRERGFPGVARAEDVPKKRLAGRRAAPLEYRTGRKVPIVMVVVHVDLRVPAVAMTPTFLVAIIVVRPGERGKCDRGGG